MACFAPPRNLLQNKPASFSPELLDKTAKYIVGDRKTADTVLRKFTETFSRDPKLTERFFNTMADLNRLHLEGKIAKPEFLRKTREAVDAAFASRPRGVRDEISNLMLGLYVNSVLGSAPKKAGRRLD